MTLTVVPFVQPVGDYSADELLEQTKGKLENALILGWTTDGSLYVAGTEEAAESFALLALAKRHFTDAYFE